MYLDITEKDILDLAKDSKYGTIIGNYTILGYLGDIPKGKPKKYVFKCCICAENPELFGLGIFASVLYTIQRQTPCACNSIFQWTESQYYKRVKKVVEEYGFSFEGFVGEFKGNLTKCKTVCPEHGAHEGSSIVGILGYNRPACLVCAVNVTRSRRISDEERISRFILTGAFHPDTTFWRSPKLSGGDPWEKYWFSLCGECKSLSESNVQCLEQGMRPCLCSKGRQKQAYLHLIYDETETPIALKFGIANKSVNRLSAQNLKNSLISRQVDVFEFESKIACVSAEKEIKSTLPCRFLSKDVFPDGYTETTEVKFMLDIMKIYKKYGGVSIMHVANDTYFDSCVAFVESTVFDINHAETSSAYFRTKDVVRD